MQALSRRTRASRAAVCLYTIVVPLSGHVAPAQAQATAGAKIAICEVRPACYVYERYIPSGANEPYCEVVVGQRQYIGGACPGFKLEGTVQEITWVDGRPAATQFRLYDSGKPAASTIETAVRHEAGRVVIQRPGAVYDCGAVGAYAPRPGSEAECDKVRDAFGDTPFAQQAPAQRDGFRVRQHQVVAAPNAAPRVKPQAEPAAGTAAATIPSSQQPAYAAAPATPPSSDGERGVTIHDPRPGEPQRKGPGGCDMPTPDPNRTDPWISECKTPPVHVATLSNADCIARAKSIQLAWRQEGDAAGGDPGRLAAAERRAQLALKELFQTRCAHFPDAAGWVARADLVLNSPRAVVSTPPPAPRPTGHVAEEHVVTVPPATAHCVTYTALKRTDSGMQWYRFSNRCAVAVNVWSAPLSNGIFGSLAKLSPGGSWESWFSISGPHSIPRLPYIACRAQEGGFEVHLDKNTMQCFYRRR
jgi:hypothetical protein